MTTLARTATLAGAAAVLLTLSFTADLSGQQPRLEQLRSVLRSDVASFGVLFQFVADAQARRTFPGQNGFSVANFRFSVSGQLDGGVDYLLQSNFGDVLDARIGLTLSEALKLDAGRFKTPYSREFLTGAGSIDFVNRSMSVTALAPGRALGVAASGAHRSLRYRVGLFNGSGGTAGNGRGRFMTVARAAWSYEGLEVAANGAWNGDRRRSPPEDVPTFRTLRRLLGVDARYSTGPWLIAAELDVGTDGFVRDDRPWGGFLTGGYHVADDTQILLRVEHLDPGESGSTRTLFVTGANYWPTGATELQVNLILPAEGFGGEPQLLINIQLEF